MPSNPNNFFESLLNKEGITAKKLFPLQPGQTPLSPTAAQLPPPSVNTPDFFTNLLAKENIRLKIPGQESPDIGLIKSTFGKAPRGTTWARAILGSEDAERIFTDLATKGQITPETSQKVSRKKKAFLSFAGGAGQTILEPAAFIADLVGSPDTAESIRRETKKISALTTFPEARKEFSLDDLLDPDFYATKGAAMLPATLMLIPAGMTGGAAGAGAAGRVATAFGLGERGAAAAKYIGSLIGAGATTAPLESLMEAGNSYEMTRNELLSRGVDEKEARSRASKAAASVFKDNLALLIGSNGFEFGLAFGRIPLPLRKGFMRFAIEKAGKLVGAAAATGAESAEELLQGYFQDVGQKWALGQRRDTDLSMSELVDRTLQMQPQQQEEAISGLLMGALFSGAGAVNRLAEKYADRKRISQNPQEAAKDLKDVFTAQGDKNNKVPPKEQITTPPPAPSAAPGTPPPAVAPPQPPAPAVPTEPPATELERLGDEIAQAVYERPFAELSPSEQDLIVKTYEKEKAKADAKKVSEAIAKRVAPKPEKVEEKVPSVSPPPITQAQPPVEPTTPAPEVAAPIRPTVTPEAVESTAPAIAEPVPSEEKPREFSSTQTPLPKDVSDKILSAAKKMIVPDDIDPTEGLEKEPHITVKFGLHTNDASEVKDLLADEPPIKAKIEGIEIFKQEKENYDVVVARVSSDDLTRLNKKISDNIENTETHPSYKPHITLGYVKKGTGDKYANAKTGLEGQTITLDTIEFSGKDRKITPIKLGGKIEKPAQPQPAVSIEPEKPAAPLFNTGDQVKIEGRKDTFTVTQPVIDGRTKLRGPRGNTFAVATEKVKLMPAPELPEALVGLKSGDKVKLQGRDAEYEFVKALPNGKIRLRGKRGNRFVVDPDRILPIASKPTEAAAPAEAPQTGEETEVPEAPARPKLHPPTSADLDKALLTFGIILDRMKGRPTAEQQAEVRRELEAEGTHPVIIDELVEPRRAPRPEERDFPEEIGIGDAYDLLRQVETQQYATTRKGRLERAVDPPTELKSKVDTLASAGKAFGDAKVALQRAKEDIITEIEQRGGEVIVNTKTGAFTIKINAGKARLRLEDLLQLKKLRVEAAEAGAYSLATVGRGFEIAVTPGNIILPEPLSGTFAAKAKEFIRRNETAKETSEALKNAKDEAHTVLLDNYLAELAAERTPSAFKGIAGDGTEAEILVRRQRSAVEPDIGEYVEKIERFKEEASARAETGKPFISTRETGKATLKKAQKAGAVVEIEEGTPPVMPPARPAAEPVISPELPEFGANNTIVTRKDLDDAFASLAKKFAVNTGLDPSGLPELLKIGTFYVEGGIREFTAWSEKMIADLTANVNATFAERVRPHLRTIFDEIKRRRSGLFKAPKAAPTAQAGLFGEEEAPAPSNILQVAAQKAKEKNVEKPIAPVPAEPMVAKEPWEMTRDEWVEAQSKMVSGQSAAKTRKLAMALHKDHVRIWLSEGRPVSAEALSHYPDLAAKQEAGKSAERFTRTNFQAALDRLEQTGNLRKGESSLVAAVTDAFANKWAEWNNSTADKFYSTAFHSFSIDTAADFAKKYGVNLQATIDEFRKAALRGEPRYLGATGWIHGKAIVSIFENARADTVLHELGHVIQNFLPEDQQRILREWASGGKVDMSEPWTKDEKEKFTRAWERYLLAGEVPNSKLKPIFQRLKELLGELYKLMHRPGLFTVELTPEVRRVLDGIFKEGAPTRVEEKPPAFEGEPSLDIGVPYEPTPERDLKDAIAEAVKRAHQAESDRTAKSTEQGQKKEAGFTPDDIAAIGHRINEIIAGKKDLKSLTPDERNGLSNLLATLGTISKTQTEKAKLSFADRIAFNDAVKQLKTPEAKAAIEKIRRAIKDETEVEPTLLDKMAEWTASMYIWRLSSVGKSISSNLAMNLLQYPEIKMAAWFNKGVAQRNKVPIQIRPQEAMQDFQVAWMGGHMKGAWREAMRFIKEETNVEQSEFFKRENIKARAIPGAAGKVIRAGLNAQAAIDVFFRTIAMQGEIARQTFRKAMQKTEDRVEALKLAEEYRTNIKMVDALQRSGKEIPEELAEFEEILNNAKKHVLVETFQEELHGVFAALSSARRHALVRIFVPFFNTQMNILKQAFLRTPFAAAHPQFLELGKKAIQKRLTQEEAGELSEQLAKMTTGTLAFGMMLLLLHWMGDDDEITGDWDIKKLSEKPLGWQANSVRVGNRYISYQGIEPFATMFRLIGNIGESKHLKNIDALKKEGKTGEVRQKQFNAFIDGLAQVTLNNPLTQEIFDIVDTAKQGKADEFFVKMVAGMALPGISQDISKIVDITARRKETLAQKGFAQAGVPGYTLTLPPVVDVFGQGIVPQTRGERLLKTITGLGISAVKDDSARAEIRRIGLKMSVRSFTHKKVKLMPDEAMRLNQMIGERFHNQVTALLKNPTYKTKSDETKKKMIVSVRTKLLNYYKKAIEQEPVFRERTKAAKSETEGEPTQKTPSIFQFAR